MSSQRLDNFAPPGSMLKKPLRERLKKDKPAAEKRPGMSPTHLALIKALPCAVCAKYAPSEPHHLKQGTGERGMRQRSTDRWAVPLCHEHHINGVERVGSTKEREWFAARGIAEPLELANALWHASGDLPKMIAILMSHRS